MSLELAVFDDVELVSRAEPMRPDVVAAGVADIAPEPEEKMFADVEIGKGVDDGVDVEEGVSGVTDICYQV